MSVTDTSSQEMPEPPDGSYVMIGISPDESVYLRDSTLGPEETPWWPLTDGGFPDNPDDAVSWQQIMNDFEPPIQVMWPHLDLWINLYRHLDDAHNAAQDPAFADGIRLSAALIADMLKVARPPWA